MNWYFIGNAVTDKFFDTYEYSETACSLRQLDNSNSTCLVVRRSTDGATQSIGFSGGDLDTSSLESFVGAGNEGYVTKWIGQGASASDYIQTTDAKQPRIVNNGSTELINTKPALNFGYVGSVHLTSTKTLTNRFTLYSVANLTSLSTSTHLWRNADGGGAIIPEYRSDLSKFNIRYNGVANYQTSSGWDTNQNLITIIAGVSSDPNLLVYKNTTQILSIANASPTSTSGTYANIGAQTTTDATNWRGSIQEMIIYDTYTTTDRASIQTDINNYWGVY